jgi:hypothetical protein
MDYPSTTHGLSEHCFAAPVPGGQHHQHHRDTERRARRHPYVECRDGFVLEHASRARSDCRTGPQHAAARPNARALSRSPRECRCRRCWPCRCPASGRRTIAIYPRECRRQARVHRRGALARAAGQDEQRRRRGAAVERGHHRNAQFDACAAGLRSILVHFEHTAAGRHRRQPQWMFEARSCRVSRGAGDAKTAVAAAACRSHRPIPVPNT